MSKKLDALKEAVFYAQQKPEKLAGYLASLISDTVTSVAISGADSITIPSGATPATETYTATVFSQFGDAMDESVTLSLKESVTGVSISSGVVSVDNTASAGSFIVVATCGTVTSEKTVALVAGE